MTQFDDVSCPRCCAQSAAIAWACDAVEHVCVCPKCGQSSPTKAVFELGWLEPVARPTKLSNPVAIPESALNEW